MANLFAAPPLSAFGAVGATEGVGGSISPFGAGGLLTGAADDFGALAGVGLIFDGAGAGAFVFDGDGAWTGLFTAGGRAAGDNVGGLASGGEVGVSDDGTGLSSGGDTDGEGGSISGGDDGDSVSGVHFHGGDSGLGAGDGRGELAAAVIRSSAAVITFRTAKEAIVERWRSSVKKLRKIRVYIEQIKLNQDEDPTADKNI